MSDTHPTLSGTKIIVEDNSQFYYTVKPYELSNALGTMITVLQEYNFIKKDDISGQAFGKLYRTTEGNWYDMEQIQMVSEKRILRMLKSAIEAIENSPGFTRRN